MTMTFTMTSTITPAITTTLTSMCEVELDGPDRGSLRL